MRALILLSILFIGTGGLLSPKLKNEGRIYTISGDSLSYPDSAKVDSICRLISLCQRVRFVETNLSNFIKRGGYHQRILGTIAKEAKVTIEIPIANGGSLVSNKQSEESLVAQLKIIKRNHGCLDLSD